MFSILIPTWNNLKFAKLLYNSIIKNSFYQHQVIFFVQEEDNNIPTVSWLTENGICFLGDRDNVGISKAVNRCYTKATREWICHVDDDMYLCPNWDYELLLFIDSYNLDKSAWVSSVMIEPIKKRWNTRIYKDFGSSVENFDEQKLLNSYKNLKINSFRDNQSNPLLIHSEMWGKVGGADEDFFAIGFEEGLAKKMWDGGCNLFVTAPKSKTYHFQNKSTGRITNRQQLSNERDSIFIKKYGITIQEFLNSCILRGTEFNG